MYEHIVKIFNFFFFFKRKTKQFLLNIGEDAFEGNSGFDHISPLIGSKVLERFVP